MLCADNDVKYDIIGTGVIVISPTRELSMQTFGVLKELLKFHSHTYGLIMGGTNKADEAKKLAKVRCHMGGIPVAYQLI